MVSKCGGRFSLWEEVIVQADADSRRRAVASAKRRIIKRIGDGISLAEFIAAMWRNTAPELVGLGELLEFGDGSSQARSKRYVELDQEKLHVRERS